jgi:hypothetical protein
VVLAPKDFQNHSSPSREETFTGKPNRVKALTGRFKITIIVSGKQAARP